MEKSLISINLIVRSKLKRIINAEEIKIELAAGSDFRDLATELCRCYGHSVEETLYTEKYGFSWLCIKNRKRVLPEEVLENGDRVILLPPLAGG